MSVTQLVPPAVVRSRFEAACSALADGGPIVLAPDGGAAPIGNLVALAHLLSADEVNRMVTHGRGLVRVVVTDADCARLQLRRQGSQAHPHLPNGEDHLASVEARSGCSTGISAADRAHTIRVAATAPGADALVTPGHVVPVLAAAGGVFERRGAPEAALALGRHAVPRWPMPALCHVLDARGAPAGATELEALAAALGAPLVSIREVARVLELELWG